MAGWGVGWKGQHSSTLQINASFVSSLFCFVWGTHVTSSITQPFNSPWGGEDSPLPGAINCPDGRLWTLVLSLQHPCVYFHFICSLCFCGFVCESKCVLLLSCQPEFPEEKSQRNAFKSQWLQHMEFPGSQMFLLRKTTQVISHVAEETSDCLRLCSDLTRYQAKNSAWMQMFLIKSNLIHFISLCSSSMSISDSFLEMLGEASETKLILKVTVHPKTQCCHHLLTLRLFQTHITFFYGT